VQQPDERTRKSFATEWGSRLLISLLLAILLWGWVTATGDPETTRQFPSIPISVEGLKEGFVLVGDVGSAEVRVTGPRSAVEDLLSTQIQAFLDLDQISEPGTYTVRIQAPKPNNTWSTTARPRKINIVVERETTKAFPVDPKPSGSLGTNQQVETVNPSASEVTVTGPNSLVERVNQVVLPIDIANRTTDFASVFTPVPIDKGGQPIAGLTLNPSTISATVEITTRGKRVAVIAQIEGEPSSGFEVVDRLVNPNTVLVDGPRDVLDSMITVNTDVVSISGAEGDVATRVRIVGLPDGVSLLEPQSGMVDVVVQIRQRGVQQPLPGQPVSVVNLTPGLAADVSPDSVILTVIGNEQELQNLTPSSLSIQVDARGLEPGTYSLRPTVLLPANMEWKSLDPSMVTVTIRREGTASPAATPAGTPIASPTP
jgi:YbbR domain-containing protein